MVAVRKLRLRLHEEASLNLITSEWPTTYSELEKDWHRISMNVIAHRDSICPNALALVKLRVLRLGLVEDRNVRVGVLPEREEVLVGNLCTDLVS